MLSATRSSASSQVVSTHSPSTFFTGRCSRSGSAWMSASATPFGQMWPRESGSVSLPRIATTRSPSGRFSTVSSRPQIASQRLQTPSLVSVGTELAGVGEGAMGPIVPRQRVRREAVTGPKVTPGTEGRPIRSAYPLPESGGGTTSRALPERGVRWIRWRATRTGWCGGTSRSTEPDAVYGVAGEGPPVLFLHGWALNHRSYRHALRRLARSGVTVYAPSMPGFGGTAELPGRGLQPRRVRRVGRPVPRRGRRARQGDRRRALLRRRGGDPVHPRRHPPGQAAGAGELDRRVRLDRPPGSQPAHARAPAVGLGDPPPRRRVLAARADPDRAGDRRGRGPERRPAPALAVAGRTVSRGAPT